MKACAVKPSFIDNRPSIQWLFIAVFLFCLFVLLQLPAAWIAARLMPNSSNISAISGNVFKGSAAWQQPTTQGMMQGTVSWVAVPWRLLLLKWAANVEVTTAETHAKGLLSIGFSSYQLDNTVGQLAPETVAQLTGMHLPPAMLQFKDVALNYKKGKGVVSADGQLNWAGGLVGYPFEGHVEKADLPALIGVLAMQKEQLHLGITNSTKERMADLLLSPDNMVDVKLTQRLLQHVAGYTGQAGADTAVVSVRQPLSLFGGAM